MYLLYIHGKYYAQPDESREISRCLGRNDRATSEEQAEHQK